MAAYSQTGVSAATIVDVRATVVGVTIDQPVRLSFGLLERRRSVLVEIETADGSVGFGESWVNWPPWAHCDRSSAFQEVIRPAMIGQDAREVEELVRRLHLALDPMGEQAGAMGPVHQAVSGVDLALWDLRCKRSDKSLSRFLDGEVDSVSVYASSLSAGPELPAACKQLLGAGFSQAKLRVGFNMEHDRRLIEEVRQLLGSDFSLIADANRAWTPVEAREMAPVLLENEITLIEEPLRRSRLEDLERLHDETGLLVAAGENLYSMSDFESLIESRAIGAVQPDVTKNGGLSLLLEVTEAATNSNVAVMPHCYGGPLGFFASCQAMASTPDGVRRAVEMPFGTAAPLWDMFGGAPVISEGQALLPSGPGFGVEPDWSWVEQHTES